MHITGLVLVWIAAVGIIGIGVAYLCRNEANAAGFGLPVLPDKDARAWWQLKGVRDITSGVGPIVFTFVETSALPWLIAVESLIAAGDMLVVLANHGSRPRAFGVHGATAALMIVAAVLLWLG